MKKIVRMYDKNSLAIRMIAAALIVCMGFADASLYIEYVSLDRNIPDAQSLVEEERELEVAYADGHYTDNNSDSENKDESIIETTEGKHLFSILEIVPTTKKGVLGYTLAGCEPFEEAHGLKKSESSGDVYLVTPQQMRTAYMDALVNPTPGAYSEHATNADNILDNESYPMAGLLKAINGKMTDSSATAPFSFVMGQYKGYYKYVGNNLGVYSIEGKDTANPKFYSRFYHSSNANDYIFVYSDARSTDPRDVYVEDQKRIRYTNNDKFLVDFLGESDPTEWRKTNVAEVVTRTPKSVTLVDIERADAIFINNGDNMQYYEYAVELKNRMNGENVDNNKTDMFDAKMDFDDFEKVIRIYERVVVRVDAAIVVEKLVCPNKTNDGFTTNMHKLMCMLFYVDKGSTAFAGRDIFTDYMKRYTSNPGKEYMTLRKLHEENPKDYPTDYRAVSLRTTDDKTNPAYYYMHYHTPYHVGHPLVLDKDEAITGGYFDENGVLKPTHNDSDYLYPITLERFDTFMFTDANIDYKEMWKDVKDGSKYYRQEFNNKYEQAWDGEYIKIDAHNLNEPPWWIPDQYIIPEGGNYGGRQRYKKVYDYVQDPNGEYIYENGSFVIPSTEQTKKEKLYYHDGAYESMSNTTDFIYIADDGTLTISNDYSSDKGDYWFRVDDDDNMNGFDFRRRIWSNETFATWPWDANMSTWLMKRKDETPHAYDCNMHMWYDYNAFRGYDDRYIAHTGDSPFDNTYKNESLMEENGMMKGSWISDALEGRDIKREKTDKFHVVEKTKKDYYISMNILNGDAVNEANPASKNKTLYYNQYEQDDIERYEKNEDPKEPNPDHNARIPINIRIKSTGKIKSITVYNSTGTVIASYDIDSDVDDKKITCTGSGGKKLELEPKNTLDITGYPEERTSGDSTPIYTYEGTIHDVMRNHYLGKRNTKITVELSAEAPDKTTKKIRDEITIVKRDFFMLD